MLAQQKWRSAGSIESAMEELAKEVASVLEPKFDQLIKKLDTLGDSLAEIGKRVEVLEHRVASVEEGEGRQERELNAQNK